LSEKKVLYTEEGFIARIPELIDPKVVENLAAKGMTQAEVARILGISVASLQNNFIEHYRKGKSRLHEILRAKQIEVAMEGDPTMLKWLGKQYLNQSEEPEPNEDDEDGLSRKKKPITISFQPPENKSLESPKLLQDNIENVAVDSTTMDVVEGPESAS